MIIDIGTFLKVEDVKAGDLIKIKSEGDKVESKFKDEETGEVKYQINFDVELSDGRNKVMSINKTSLKNLGDKYGYESKDWIGKLAKVNIGVMPNAKKFIILEPVE